jgi:signal transduction histidine kinase
MDWYTVNYALGSVVSFLAGLFVLLRGEVRRPTRRTWFSLCLFVGLWHAGHLLMEMAQTEAMARRAVYPIYVGAILIPPCYMHFILSLLAEERRNARLLAACYFLAAVEMFFLFGGWLIEGVKRYPRIGFYEVPADVYWLYFANYLIVPGLAMVKLVAAFFRTDVITKKNQLKYVIYSSLIGFVSGTSSFLPFMGDGISPAAAPVVYFYTVPITYAVARYRLMDISVAIKKSLIYTLLLLGLLVPCYLLVIWTQKVTFGTISYGFSVTTLILFFIVGFLFPKFRFRTEDALERVLFRKRYDYRDTLSRSSRDMVSMVDLDALSNNLVLTVGRALGVQIGSLFLVDDLNGTYGLKASMGVDSASLAHEILAQDDPLVRRLARRGEPLVKGEIQMAGREAEAAGVVGRMDRLRAEISLPIISKGKLIGILNLGHKERREMYSEEDLGLLSTLANQAAIAIENARLYENLKKSQSIIRRADRLSSLGQLTAGLAHEIRNPLVAIRTLTQLLPERYQDTEFRESFRTLALKEVERICGLLNSLLSFARPSQPNIREEEINDIVQTIVSILETEAKEKNVKIDLRLAPGLPNIFVDKEQIKQVCMNIILNAIQAIEGAGRVEISTHLFVENSRGRHVQIRVRDTGVGIPKKDLESIFNPFFTTKREGSGLGLSISHQIVQEHGGHILVESQEKEGTTFFVNLPIKSAQRVNPPADASPHEEHPSR